ncbi:energy transducer TonB [Helicobacter baculiformis]|uniref:Energy transducer TonB n=1 Tax=Helicobacter baculiformis TaxID=427351 RepID=A0ABV7ZK89_9HELI|nr:TonB family protein [Helicobacter baculiformis]
MSKPQRYSSLALDKELANRRATRNFYISLLISCLLHLLIWWLVDYGYKLFKKPKQPKLVRLSPSNLLVLKRGRSLDPTKHTQGALKPSKAAPKHVPTPPSHRYTPPIRQHHTARRHRERPRHRVEERRAERREVEPRAIPHHSEETAMHSEHKALHQTEHEVTKKVTPEKPQPPQEPIKHPAPEKPTPPKPVKKPEPANTAQDFNPNNLSFLPSEQTPVQPPARTKSYENDKGLDTQTRKDIDDLYGEEFGDLGTAEKDFIKSNLSEIGRITQKYLEYPSAAGYLGQDGVDAVEFYLHPNGDITGLKIIMASGYKLLDDNTLKTITIAYKDYPRPTTTTLIRIRVRYFIYR